MTSFALLQAFWKVILIWSVGGNLGYAGEGDLNYATVDLVYAQLASSMNDWPPLQYGINRTANPWFH